MPVIGTHSRPPRNALIAAASKRSLEQVKTQRPVSGEGDDYLWNLYDRLGELGYGVGFKANAATRLRYFVAETGEGEDEPTPTDNQAAIAAFERVNTSIALGDFTEIVGELVTHLEVVGEGHFVGQTTADGEEFDVWSNSELQREVGSRKTRNRIPDAADLEDNDPLIVRVWRPHPRDRALPESPLRHTAEAAERLVLIGGAIDAALRSRLLGKILGVPDELTFVSATQLPDTGAEADGDPFMDELIETITTAVRDERSAARIAPVVIRGPGDRLQQITVEDLVRDLPEKLLSMEEAAIRRVAAGMDLPAEVLLGLSDVNHWTAWQVDESAYRQHVDPVVQLVLESLTRGYLWPALEAEDVDDPRQFVLWRDMTPIVARNPAPSDVVGLFDRGIIAADTARNDLGYSEADKPSEAGVDVSQSAETLGQFIDAGFTPESAIQAISADDLSLLVHSGDEPVTTRDTEPPEPEAEDNQPGPPPSAVTAAATPARRLDDLAVIDRNLHLRISEAADAAIERALERAGAKIRSHARKDRTATAAIDGVDNMQVGLTLGPDAVYKRFQLSDDELLPVDTFDRLAGRVRRLLASGIDTATDRVNSILGIDDYVPPAAREGWLDQAVGYLIDAVAALTLSKLFTPDTALDPATTGEIGDTTVRASDVWDTMTIAGGGTPSPGLPNSPRGVALGDEQTRRFVDAGWYTTGYVWEYGDPSTRQTQFPPHRALDGVQFSTFEDDALANLSAGWVGVSHFFPGDHRGCGCNTIPVVTEQQPTR